MQTEHLGSCLCGAVRFRITGAFERFYLCHCSHCRKDTGSAHAQPLFVHGQDRMAVRTGPSEHLQAPANAAQEVFCAICGSALPISSPTMLVVPAGSLDTQSSITPDGNIFTASRAAWDRDLALAPGFDTYPP